MQNTERTGNGIGSQTPGRSDRQDLTGVLGPLRLEPQPTARDRVVNILRTAILTGKILSGQRLPEVELAHQLNVSRIPIREAFSVLETEGLLQRESNRGVVVADIRVEDMEEVYLLRSQLEGFAAERAASRLNAAQKEHLAQLGAVLRTRIETREFADYSDESLKLHAIIWEAAGKTTASLCQIIYQKFPKSLGQTWPERTEQTNREHLAIIEALLSGDGAQAQQAMQRHIDSGRRLLARRVLQMVEQRRAGTPEVLPD